MPLSTGAKLGSHEIQLLLGVGCTAPVAQPLLAVRFVRFI
jgi:hypothetical protein